MKLLIDKTWNIAIMHLFFCFWAPIRCEIAPLNLFSKLVGQFWSYKSLFYNILARSIEVPSFLSGLCFKINIKIASFSFIYFDFIINEPFFKFFYFFRYFLTYDGKRK
jgi:hypothetical protein